MNIQCIRCKGRLFCGRSACPTTMKARIVSAARNVIHATDYNTIAPAPFVGRFGYPNVSVGILAPPKVNRPTDQYDNPRKWARDNISIPDLVSIRSNLINSQGKTSVKDTASSLAEDTRLITLARKPPDIDVSLKDRPRFRLNTDPYLSPTGPVAQLQHMEITSNIRIPRAVEKTDGMTATEAVKILYKKDFDENYIAKALSVGTFGDNKKLVPTRWSITATDDMLGKSLITDIRSYPESDYLAFFGGHLSNYFLILFFPGPFRYELFETYMPNSSFNQSNKVAFTTDYEDLTGRNTYADNTAGGYYAARLPILEKLKSMKRSASVLAIRVITPEYSVPLGVWVVREAVRKSIVSKPIKFADSSLMLRYAQLILKKRFNMDLSVFTKASRLLNDRQSRLTSF